MTPRWHWLTGAAVWAACLVLYLGHRESQFYLHFALTQLCHGVSTGKILFFLLFMIALDLRLAGARPLATSTGGRRWLTTAMLATVLGLSASLLSHLLYVRAMGLPLDWASWHWRAGINSVTSLTHVHTSKAPIAVLLDALGLTRAHRAFDTGWVYATAVPSWLVTLIGAAFLAALVGWLAAARRVVLRYPANQRWAVALVYGMAGAAATKSVLDGGLLAYDAVAGLLTLALLADTSDLAALPDTLRRRTVLLVCALAAWAGVIIWFDPSSMQPQLERLAYRLAIHGSVLGACVALMMSSSTARWRWGAAAGLCAAMAVGFVARDWRVTLQPLLEPAPRAAVTYDAEGHATTVALPEGLNRKQAYTALGQKPFRVRRVSLHDPAAVENDQPTGLIAEVIPLDARQATLGGDDDGVVSVRRVEPSPEPGRQRLRLQVEFDGRGGPCVCCPSGQPMTQVLENERFVAYHLLDERLRRGGLERYVLIPYGFYRKPPRAPQRAAPPDSSSGLVQAATDVGR